jgi:hypothetical protein
MIALRFQIRDRPNLYPPPFCIRDGTFILKLDSFDPSNDSFILNHQSLNLNDGTFIFKLGSLDLNTDPSIPKPQDLEPQA